MNTNPLPATVRRPEGDRSSRPNVRAAYSASRRPVVRGGRKDELSLPGYKVLGLLGCGGMARVYKVRQLCPRRLVAVKVIDRGLAGDREIIARFRQEQALGARLRHPNLIHIYLPSEFEGFPLRKDFPLLSREVKPWPGLVDVEPFPPGTGGDNGADPAALPADEAG